MELEALQGIYSDVKALGAEIVVLAPELERYARGSSPGIREDGRRKVLAGETTLEEVLRVTRED